MRNVVAAFDHAPVESDMLAAVHDFLHRESLDLGLQPRRRTFTKRLHAFNEKSLAARKGDRQRIVPGRRDGIAAMPPTLLHRATPETTVARRNRQIGGGFRGKLHE